MKIEINREAALYGIGGLLIGVLLTLVVMNCIHDKQRNWMHDGKMHDKMKMQMDKPEKQSVTMDEITEMLKDETGDEFDRVFLKMMIEHHQGAIDMANLISTRAKHDEIKKLGQDIISAQTKEITDMEGWAKNWGYTSETKDSMSGMQH